MAEGTGLENRHTGEPGIVSSNLTLSASLLVTAEDDANERRRGEFVRLTAFVVDRPVVSI